MIKKKLFGVVGSVVLFLGVFMPIVSMPFVGELNYFRNGQGDGVIILVLAGISLILALTERFKGLWFTGLGSYLVILFTFFVFTKRISIAKRELETELAKNHFRGIASTMAESIQLGWGWAIMFLGAVMIIISALEQEHEEKSHECAKQST